MPNDATTNDAHALADSKLAANVVANDFPTDLRRAIADMCSLTSLRNLQLVSKDWAAACRGVGSKFRDTPLDELFVYEQVEIDLFVKKSVRVALREDRVEFRLAYPNDEVSTEYAPWGAYLDSVRAQKDADRLVARAWAKKRGFLVASVMAANALSLVDPLRFFPKDVRAPDDLRWDIWAGTQLLEKMASNGGFEYSDDYHGEYDWEVNVDVWSDTTGRSMAFRMTFGTDVTCTEIETDLWDTDSTRSARHIFARRSARAAPPVADVALMIGRVDMKKIVGLDASEF